MYIGIYVCERMQAVAKKGANNKSREQSGATSRAGKKQITINNNF